MSYKSVYFAGNSDFIPEMCGLNSPTKGKNVFEEELIKNFLL